ncbi:unnamed protein product [Caenorhabditis brenneri]
MKAKNNTRPELTTSAADTNTDQEGESSTSVGCQLTERLREESKARVALIRQLLALEITRGECIENVARSIDEKLSNNDEEELNKAMEDAYAEQRKSKERNAAHTKTIQRTETSIQKSEVQLKKIAENNNKLDEEDVEQQRIFKEMVAHIMPHISAPPQGTQKDE